MHSLLSTKFINSFKRIIVVSIVFFAIGVSAQAQNNSLHFDGSSDVVSIPNNSTQTMGNTITIETWVKWGGSSNIGNILMKGSYGYGIGISANGSIKWWNSWQQSSGPNSTIGAVTAGVWTHIAVVVDKNNTNTKFYINGVLNATVTGADINNNTESLYLGTQGTCNCNFYQGNLDELRIWNTVRTQSEIQANMNVELTTATGLVANYHFNQGTAGGTNTGLTSLTDASGNNNTGTLSTFALTGATSNWVASGVTFPSPVISSFSPLTGNAGATVTLTGTGFNTTASNNIVFFGATKATVSAATATSLTVTVPAGATYGPLTLVDLSINKTINSKKFFTPTFSPSKGILTAADFSTEQEFSTGTTEPNKIAATGDLDGDGKPDIIIADGAGSKMLILRNTGSNGTAGFETALTLTSSGSQTSLNVGDIDGDGKLDIVEVDYSNSSLVSVYLNTTSAVGSISFATPVTLNPTVNNYKLQDVAISDLDGDGKADLAIVNNEGKVLLFRNTGSVGTVSFATKVEVTAGTGPKGIMIGDIDSDGLPDIAITSKGTSIRVLRNTSTSGTLNFVNSGDFTIGGTEPNSLALGDLDGDGKLDIATVNYYGNNVSVLLNTSTSGTVSFASKTDFAIGRNAAKIALGDLNGDGKLDVVITLSGAVLSIFTNTTTTAGAVTFAPMIDIASTGSSLQAIIADLDGDGKTDFATGGSKKLLVFHNGDPLANADLKALSISVGTLAPTFTPANTAYTAIVENTTTSITVTPTQTQSNATATLQVRVNAGTYASVTSATASNALALNVGSNTIDVKVTAADGTTIKTYTITVTRDIPVPSYIVSGAGTAAVNGVYVYFGKNSSGKQVWQYGSYFLASDGYEAWISTFSNRSSFGGHTYRASSSSTDPTKWTMTQDYGASPAPVIELAGPKVSYASFTLIENSSNDGSIRVVTTITHNNFSSATFKGSDGENFIASGKAIATGVPAGLTAVIIRNNNLQLTLSLTGNANAHANANDISNLNITFQNSAFSDNDAANTINYSTNLSVNFIEQINVGSGQTYTTIQSAVNAAGNGDVLLLAAQTFTEQNITIANKSLTIIGVSPAATIVQANANAGAATGRVFNITNTSYSETNQNTFDKITIRNGNVANGNSDDKAGGLYAKNTTLILKNCVIESNKTGTTSWGGYGLSGAGIYVEASNLISENCTYNNNALTCQNRPGDSMGGGAIGFFISGGLKKYMTVTNCTFSNNSSGNFGGAIMINRNGLDLSDISITNCTFVGNSASNGGAFSSMGSGLSTEPTYLTNSLFYGNTATSAGSQIYSSNTTAWTVNNCLFESTSAGNLTGVFTNCIVGSDPLLGALVDNGGDTKTYSIGSGSPAINSGTTTGLTVDQRRFTIVGARDIGAYEYNGILSSSDANLSAMTVSAGTLNPSFASGTTTYTNILGNTTASITVTPTIADANATIQVRVNGGNYATVSSANASNALALNIGSNTVDVTVTAQDSYTTKSYTLTVTRPGNNQTITFPNFAAKSTTSPDFEPGATVDSGFPLTYTSSNPLVAEVYQDGSDGNKWKIKIKGNGQTDIRAIQSGNADYNPTSFLRMLEVTGTLPVNLINYQAKTQNNKEVLLSWSTESEQNNDGFEILKSTDGINFSKITFVKGKGNSDNKKQYSFVDATPAKGTNYYKLVQVDLDGAKIELGIKAVTFGFVENSQISVYPNPAANVLNLEFEAASYSNITILDLSGKVIIKKEIAQTDSKISLNISELPASIYVIKLQGVSGVMTKQFVKQ